MAIITFTSDFGLQDHYVAAVKAKILSFSQNLKIIDITHQIKAHDVQHGAFVLKSVFRDFPQGTVHLVSVNTQTGVNDKLIAMKIEEHYFVGSDNGLFSLLSDKTPTAIVELKKDISNKNYDPSFPEKTTLASAAASLANVVSIYNLGPQLQNIRSFSQPSIRTTKNNIFGRVIHIDSYGNLITDITKDSFLRCNENRNFVVTFSRENVESISEDYSDVSSGDCLCLFNSNGLLEIAIRDGDASALLGMNAASVVTISFLESKVESISLL